MTGDAEVLHGRIKAAATLRRRDGERSAVLARVITENRTGTTGYRSGHIGSRSAHSGRWTGIPPALHGSEKSFLILEEVPMRTFSVSLLAVAAIAAGLVLAREADSRKGSSEACPPEEPLDAIRAAGL